MAEALPDGVAEHLPAAIASMEARMVPVRADVLAGLMVRLWDSGVPKPEAATLVQWRRLLEGYPADVLGVAVDEVAKSHVWPRPPAVADVVKFCRPEMDRRAVWLRKLKTAKVRADMDAKNRKTDTARETPEERAAFVAKMREKYPEGVAAAVSCSAKTMPGTVKTAAGRTSEWEGLSDADIPRLREAALRGLEAGQ